MESIFLQHFWDGIESGRFIPLENAELDQLVEQVFFSHNPLVELTPEEEGNIRENVLRRLEDTVNRCILVYFAENECMYFGQKRRPVMLSDLGIEEFLQDSKQGRYKGIDFELVIGQDSPVTVSRVKFPYPFGRIRLDRDFVVFTDFPVIREDDRYEDWRSFLGIIGEKIDAEPLTKTGKINLLSDPVRINCLEAYCPQIGVGEPYNPEQVISQGYRELVSEDGYFKTEKEFVDLLADIRHYTGIKPVRMLDLGGGMGLACHNAQELDADVTATNVTIDEEPAMYDVHTVYSTAERLPKSFKESFDLTVSNVAFRYFTYPDIAMEGLFASTSVGGIANLSVGGGCSRVEVQDYSERVAHVDKRLDDLQEIGCIQRIRGWSFQKIRSF